MQLTLLYLFSLPLLSHSLVIIPRQDSQAIDASSEQIQAVHSGIEKACAGNLTQVPYTATPDPYDGVTDHKNCPRLSEEAWAYYRVAIDKYADARKDRKLSQEECVEGFEQVWEEFRSDGKPAVSPVIDGFTYM